MSIVPVSINEIQANPFRRIESYPIDENKVAELMKSIEATGYWENILCRKNNGKIELAYGHHRIEALKRKFGKDKIINVNVQDLDNNSMMKIMARENSETWKNSEIIDRETAKSSIFAYANGDITLEEIPESTNLGFIRYAPSFSRKSPTLSPRGERVENPYPYTATILAKFLGWGENKTSEVLRRLEAIEDGIIEESDILGLTKEEADAVIATAKEAYETEKETTKEDNPEKKDKKAKKYSKDVAKKASEEFKKAKKKKALKSKAREILTKKIRKIRTEDAKSQRKEINAAAYEIKSHIEGIFSSAKDKKIEVLEKIIELKEFLSPTASKALLKSLLELSNRINKFINALQYSENPIKEISHE
jgi:ParB-like chromosome segregation protein Spo0J